MLFLTKKKTINYNEFWTTSTIFTDKLTLKWRFEIGITSLDFLGKPFHTIIEYTILQFYWHSLFILINWKYLYSTLGKRQDQSGVEFHSVIWKTKELCKVHYSWKLRLIFPTITESYHQYSFSEIEAETLVNPKSLLGKSNWSSLNNYNIELVIEQNCTFFTLQVIE